MSRVFLCFESLPLHLNHSSSGLFSELQGSACLSSLPWGSVVDHHTGQEIQTQVPVLL